MELAVEYRPEAVDDHAEIAALTRTAFRDQGRVARLVDALRSGPARLSIVAVDAQAVVGHIMLSRGWVDAPKRLIEVLILSPLSVAPVRQGRGIGAALVRAALERADAPAVFLEGDPAYYHRFGFRPGARLGCISASSRIPEAAFQVVPLAGWQPEFAGRLVYPDAFWAHDCVGLRSA